MTHGVWRMMYDVWRMTCDVTCITYDVWHYHDVWRDVRHIMTYDVTAITLPVEGGSTAVKNYCLIAPPLALPFLGVGNVTIAPTSIKHFSRNLSTNSLQSSIFSVCLVNATLVESQQWHLRRKYMKIPLPHSGLLRIASAHSEIVSNVAFISYVGLQLPFFETTVLGEENDGQSRSERTCT